MNLRALSTYQPETAPDMMPHKNAERANVLPTYESLEDTRIAMEKLRIETSQPYWARNSQSSFIPELHAVSKESLTEAKVRRYNQSLEYYINVNGSSLNREDLYTIHEVKLNVILTSFNITASVAKELENEESWHEWSNKCRGVMVYAEAVIRHPESVITPPPGLDSGLIWLLALVVVRGDGDAVSRRALEIMRMRERSESVWNSFVAAEVVEKLLQQTREDKKTDPEVPIYHPDAWQNKSAS